MGITFGRMDDLPPNLRAALGVENTEEKELTWPNPDVVAQTLKDGLAAYETHHVFQKGDMVKQKPGLEKYGHKGPFIFVRFLHKEEIVKNEGGNFDPESSDCIVGVRTPTGSVIFVSVCQYRLEPWNEGVAVNAEK